MTKSIVVTGATGFVGRHVVTALLQGGYHVRALTRNRTKAGQVLPQHDHLELVVGDALSEPACADLAAGADAAIHLVGILRETPGQTFERVHEQATRNVVRACEANHVKRYIHMSALGASPLGRAAYQRTKFGAERIVRTSSLDWTILRPGLIHGPDGEFIKLAAAWARGLEPPHFFMPYFSRLEYVNGHRERVAPLTQPIHVDDVVRAIFQSLEREEAIGEVYPLAGSERLSWPELLEVVRDTIPARGPRLAAVGIPGELAATKARL
ncbi:MAG: SDR family NAD(P)-dependent oxidoreductase, partial [Planctomycetota bacterium]